MKRSIPLCVVLFFVTFGLYGLYWQAHLHEELNRRAGRKKYIPGGRAVLLTLLTVGLYGIYWAFKMGKLIDVIKTKKGYWSQNTGTQFLILALFGFQIFNLCTVQDALNTYHFDDEDEEE